MRPWLCSNDHPREAGGTSVTHIANAHRTTIARPTNYQLFSSIRPSLWPSRPPYRLIWVKSITQMPFATPGGAEEL